ncbi:hypothetical protein CSB20_00635 [bacterium DOLZORAL124_64_63]|nr:MAG: hypothetical protein CSB20_00635 [bacterium DOLZORAL124_64_63]
MLYYGAVQSGKRENLRLINQSLPPDNRLSLACADPERQIAFRLKTDRDGEWQVLVQAMDAGKEPLPMAGRGLQAGFDGVVLVISSRAPHLDQALASLEGLKAYLDAWGLDLMTLPVIIQYNQREAVDALPLDRLESLINPWGLLSYPASTTRGEGVRETLKSVLGLSVNHAKERIAPVMDVGADLVLPEAGLGVEVGPALPGSEDLLRPQEQGNIFGQTGVPGEAGSPLVVPVRIPRRCLAQEGKVRLVLEVEVVD